MPVEPDVTLRPSSRYRPVLRALRRRRRRQAAFIELFYVLGGLALGVTLPHLSWAKEVASANVVLMLFSLAAAIVTFASVVFSVLFLVVQFGSTTLSPRLTLFRDNPIITHSFGLSIGIFVYACAAAIVLIGRPETTVLVPIFAAAALFAVLATSRKLQSSAFRSIQFAPTMRDLAVRTTTVLEALYREPFAGARPAPPLPDVSTPVYWGRPGGVLRQVDLPGLVDAAERLGCVIELSVPVGGVVRPRGVVLLVRGAADVPDQGGPLLQFLEVGLERSFDQDPLLGIRLLVDIALRGMSPAVNDPTTAVEVIDVLDGLLARIVDRDLDLRYIGGVDDDLRVVLPVPTWDDYVSGAVDELAYASRQLPSVSRRLLHLLADVATTAPAERRAALEARIRWIEANCDPGVTP
ncbi:MAG: DUF2254 family protein [Acidimicrobiales bacterium]